MDELIALVAGLPVRALAAGDVLIEEGADPGPMYVLSAGAMTVERDGVPFARVESRGAVFGEMSVVLGRPATATVRAASDAQVHVVTDPEAFLVEQPGAALAVLRTTAARLEGMTRYLADVRQQFEGLEGSHLGMVGTILDTLVHHQAPAARTGSARDPEGDH